MVKGLLDKLVLSPNVHVVVFTDNSFVIRQVVCTYPSIKLNFGPVEISLGELFNNGWFLQGEGWTKTNCVTIRLRNNTRHDAYKLYKLHRYAGSTNNQSGGFDLCDPIKDGQQLMFKASVLQRDPLDVLKEKFPVIKSKKPVMIGNMTLNEWLDENYA